MAEEILKRSLGGPHNFLHALGSVTVMIVTATMETSNINKIFGEYYSSQSYYKPGSYFWYLKMLTVGIFTLLT